MRAAFRPRQRLGQKRKRSQGIEDLVPQTKDQLIDLHREKDFQNGERRTSSATITINKQKQRQSSGKKWRRAFSPESLSEETNNCYPKRRKALRQTPQQPDTSTYSRPIFERPEEGPEASESEEEEKDDISNWATNHTWPDNFAEPRSMSSSNNTNKRQRTTDCSQSGKDEKSWTHSQSRRNKDVPHTPRRTRTTFTHNVWT